MTSNHQAAGSNPAGGARDIANGKAADRVRSGALPRLCVRRVLCRGAAGGVGAAPVAGPIVRATEFLPQLKSDIRPNRAEVAHAVGLIARGLFEKVVIADSLARAVVKDAFEAPGEHGALDVLAGVYGYAVQIYADFSGYTDMAIGVALLTGFRFPQNFDVPYAADSIQD